MTIAFAFRYIAEVISVLGAFDIYPYTKTIVYFNHFIVLSWNI